MRYAVPSLNSSGVFYTDSNGREYVQRIRNQRSSWNLTLTEPVSSNYYPVVTTMRLLDVGTGVSLYVLNDRSNGGSFAGGRSVGADVAPAAGEQGAGRRGAGRAAVRTRSRHTGQPRAAARRRRTECDRRSTAAEQAVCAAVGQLCAAHSDRAAVRRLAPHGRIVLQPAAARARRARLAVLAAGRLGHTATGALVRRG